MCRSDGQPYRIFESMFKPTDWSNNSTRGCVDQMVSPRVFEPMFKPTDWSNNNTRGCVDQMVSPKVFESMVRPTDWSHNSTRSRVDQMVRPKVFESTFPYALFEKMFLMITQDNMSPKDINILNMWICEKRREEKTRH